MVKYIKPPDKEEDVMAYLRFLYLKTEQRLIHEIKRKRTHNYVDYAEVAALERTQKILQEMVDNSWDYIPAMLEKIFYKTEKAAKGYANARSLTIAQTSAIQQLSNNLLGEVMEASASAQKSVEKIFLLARQEEDALRKAALKTVTESKAAGYGARQAKVDMEKILRSQGITSFTDKAGRKWSLSDYCNMATRTTARQAQVAAILTADPGHDLYKIVKIGATCPVCAPLEGRVYSRSGTNPEYPALTKAFGKIDAAGSDDISNTYLNIHPNCLHSIVKYTTIGKSEEQIQKDKDFSSFEKNPITNDPRSKKQIEAYREKVRNRQKLLRDKKQHKAYQEVLGNKVPKDFEKFREMKYNKTEQWKETQAIYQKTNAYNKIIANEPEITADLRKVSDTTGVSMVGLEYRIKTKESFMRKIGTDSKYSLNSQVITDTIHSTNDVIRYTYQDSALNLSNAYKSVTDILKKKGYKAIKVKNTWLNHSSAYKGVNCIFQAPSGQKFEIQFHTPESFKLKNGVMHKLYEEARKDTTTPERRAELNKKMFELSERLEIPANIGQIN
ncbi:MAG: hypothetical protein HFG39_15410 [Lachnospiraceae bacterium]|nr:hypothetical protein [Lachnospiraceae bacterium]